MVKNITRMLILSWFVCFTALAVSPPSESDKDLMEVMLDKYGTTFANLEHKLLGNQVILHFPKGTNKAEEFPLTLPNGLILTYGEIIMFAGDLIGDHKHPITSCPKDDRFYCFERQFNALAVHKEADNSSCTNTAVKVQKLNQYFKDVSNQIDKEVKKGMPIWKFYEKNATYNTKQLNKLTCGGSFISAYFPFGEYIKLAEVNFDHFLPDAKTAYTIGHKYALYTAIQGYNQLMEGNEVEANRLLSMAYAQNAYANHYLTDSFSSGHIRTPRRHIHNDIFLPAVMNLLIANFMHDEDSKLGLTVTNKYGRVWKAYGDGHLLSEKAKDHRSILLMAMQESADAIYDAFINGEIPQHYSELDLFPDYKRVNEFNQTAPLFKVKKGKLLKRQDNHNVHDFHWTSDWTGIGVLIDYKL